MKFQIKITLILFLCGSVILSGILTSWQKEEDMQVPVLITEVTSIYAATAECRGTITDYGSGEITGKGFCWSTSSPPTFADNHVQVEYIYSGAFSSTITDLEPVTTYYARAFAINSAGIGYGNEISFSTGGKAPSATTQPATNIGMGSATLNAVVNGYYLNTTVIFEYGLTTSYGSETRDIYRLGYSAIFLTSVYDSTVIFAWVNGLNSGTTYHCRIKAENPLGTSYGNDLTFTTSNKPADNILVNPNLAYESVRDVDGNTYRTIQIGTQTWMAENLRVTSFNDGTPLVKMPLEDHIYNAEPGYCWYNNDEETYKTVFGALYNPQAVDPQLTNKNICPTGWHVPTDEEWKVLEMHLGISREDADLMGYRGTTAGSAIKESGTINWVDESVSGTNETGFTGLPDGSRSLGNAAFGGDGIIGLWWTDTELYPDPYNWGYCRWVFWEGSFIARQECEKRNALNVRCIKD